MEIAYLVQDLENSKELVSEFIENPEVIFPENW